MAGILGKRKRRAEIKPDARLKPEESDSGDDETARALFQRAFEAKFKPLETKAKPVEEVPEDDSEDDDSDDESDWNGLSEDEEEVRVEVVQHAEPMLSNDPERNIERKAFMSSKPPTLEDSSKISVAKMIKQSATDEEDGTEVTNLKKDLELQRLLKESHLLHPSTFHGSSSTPDGKGRLKALDMRLQDLGAKASILQQEKMPLAHRKGIANKSASREASRRKEAAENGIILEKARNAPKAQKHRDRGIGGPGIGKFRGGTLTLSSRDIKSIQSSKSDARGRKGRRK